MSLGTSQDLDKMAEVTVNASHPNLSTKELEWSKIEAELLPLLAAQIEESEKLRNEYIDLEEWVVSHRVSVNADLSVQGGSHEGALFANEEALQAAVKQLYDRDITIRSTSSAFWRLFGTYTAAKDALQKYKDSERMLEGARRDAGSARQEAEAERAALHQSCGDCWASVSAVVDQARRQKAASARPEAGDGGENVSMERQAEHETTAM